MFFFYARYLGFVVKKRLEEYKCIRDSGRDIFFSKRSMFIKCTF